MTEPEDVVAEAERLLSAATPGLWINDLTPLGPSGAVCHREAIITPDKKMICSQPLYDRQKSGQIFADFSFICFARNRMAELVARVRELERQRDNAEAWLEFQWNLAALKAEEEG